MRSGVVGEDLAEISGTRVRQHEAAHVLPDALGHVRFAAIPCGIPADVDKAVGNGVVSGCTVARRVWTGTVDPPPAPAVGGLTGAARCTRTGRPDLPKPKDVAIRCCGAVDERKDERLLPASQIGEEQPFFCIWGLVDARVAVWTGICSRLPGAAIGRF